MGCVKGGVVANVVVPTASYVRFATHYGFRPDFCEAADPESKGAVEALVRYVKPARLDDLLEVSSRVSERRRASFTFFYEITNEGREVVATGHPRHACWDPATARMIAIPDWLKEIMPDADLDPTDR